MQMEEGLDTGPVLARAEIAIGETETAAGLHDRLAELGAATLVATLARLTRGAVHAEPQAATHACYARKLRKEEALIDWQQPARTLHCKIRAFNPWPVAHTTFRGRSLRLWEVAPLTTAPLPPAVTGTIVRADANGVVVAAADAAVTITRLQLEGGKVLAAVDFINGQRVTAGERFGT
jgi:methionyl-tRNA formyltransferase